MKINAITLLSLPLLVLSAACAHQPGNVESGRAQAASVADSLAITPRSARDIRQGDDDFFSGSARVESLFAATEDSRAAAAEVSFVPGSRTAWHTHPRGQVLVVTDGVGLVQRRGGPVEVIRKGDVVRIPAGVEHWHGAAATTPVTHIAIQEHDDGRVVEWGRYVSDAEYAAGAGGR